jgi:hypothetical protein
VHKRLSDLFTLQCTKHLRELRICQSVSLVFSTSVQRCPLGFPIKGNDFGFVGVEELAEVVKADVTGSIGIKESKCHLVLCIWLGQEVLKVCPVRKCHSTGSSAVSYNEEETILLAQDLVLLLSDEQPAVLN